MRTPGFRALGIRGAAVLFLFAGWSLPAGGAGITVLEIRQAIQPVTADYIARGITEAERNGSKLILIEVDTPGGLVSSTRAITSRILESRVPVAVYVSPKGARAASGGFVVLLSADIAVMSPATNTGAAHPVGLGGGSPGDKDDHSDFAVMFKKLENDMAAMVRSLATTRGRDVEAAEKAVVESVSYTEREAIDKKLIDFVAVDRADLIRQLDGRMVRRSDGSEAAIDVTKESFLPIPLTTTEKFFSFVLDPQVVGILILLGLAGVGWEVTHPGLVLPGVIGAVSLLLVAFALANLPVNLGGVGLLVLAIGLFAAEFKVTSHGLFGIAGAIAMVIGGALLIDAPIPEMRLHWSTYLPTAVLIAASLAFMATRAASLRLRPATTGAEGLIGQKGDAVTALAPTGKVFAEGAYWDAESDLTVEKGEKVEIVAVRGLSLRVRPVIVRSNSSPAVEEPGKDGAVESLKSVS